VSLGLIRPRCYSDCIKCSKGLLAFFYFHGSVHCYIQGVPGGKVNIMGGNSIGHSKQKTIYQHVSYSERFPR
jgi:hypothetical protein